MNEKAGILEFLRDHVALFRGFSANRLKELVEGSEVITFEPHEAIIECGEEGRFLGILLDGEAEISITDNAGEKHVISVLKQGDIFGEVSLMTGDKTMANIIGVIRCKALIVPQHLFSTILVTHPPAVAQLSRSIVDRLKTVAYDEKGHELAAAAFQKSDDPYGFKLKTDDPMRLLIINCGSSSLKYNLFDTADEKRNARGSIERIGSEGTVHKYESPKGRIEKPLPKGGHAEAFGAMVAALTDEKSGVIGSPIEVTAIGHRVVHGGDKYSAATIITDEVLKTVEELGNLAPLHNPINVIGIREAMRLFPHAPNVGVFDTAFHQTLPAYAYLYGLPYEYYEEKRIRRYGFHGTSHMYVSLKAAEYLKRPFNELEMVVCHLGNGASVCAVDHGRSVDTTMGLTPAEGLIMGTRCGDIDPAILLHLMRTEGMGHDDLDRLINKQSGLLGLSGISNDMREIEMAANNGDPRALLAFKTFSYRIRKTIGAYVAAMGGMDVLIFTGGIGQGSPGVRSLACQGLRYMGIVINEQKNRSTHGFDWITDISEEFAPVRVLVVPTNEERMIARETIRALSRNQASQIIKGQDPIPIPIEISAHHLHLAQDHVEALFGEGRQLTPIKDLSQPGQFACKEIVSLVGPRGRVERVRVLGPTRKETQVEISMTEQFQLGIAPPIRASGDIDESPGCTIEGPEGSVAIDKGVICALRHIHMAPEDALRLGLRDRDMVMVRVKGERELIFGDVLVRVHPSFRLAMHLDTDEGNSAGIKTGDKGYIERIQSRA
jgi:acetate kinase